MTPYTGWKADTSQRKPEKVSEVNAPRAFGQDKGDISINDFGEHRNFVQEELTNF